MNNQFLTLLITQTWQIAALAVLVAVVVKFAAKNRPLIDLKLLQPLLRRMILRPTSRW